MTTLSPQALLAEGPVLLYDGECGVCSGSVQWILAHERRHDLRFAALQSDLGRSLRLHAQIPEDVDSIIWIEAKGDQLHAKKWSNALVVVFKYVGGPWQMLSWIRVVPPPLRDAAYRLFAKHRLKFAPTSCLLPPPQTRARFLSA